MDLPHGKGSSTMTLVALTTQTTSPPGCQVQLVGGLARHEAHEAVRPGLDLHDGGDAVTLDARDRAAEAVARALGHDGPLGAAATPLGGQS